MPRAIPTPQTYGPEVLNGTPLGFRERGSSQVRLRDPRSRENEREQARHGSHEVSGDRGESRERFRWSSLTRQSRPQPPDLSAMIDLVLRDMKPREMRVHRGGRGNRPVEPLVVAHGELLERDAARVGHVVEIM